MEVQWDCSSDINYPENLAHGFGTVVYFRPKARGIGVADVADFLHRKQGILITFVLEILKSRCLMNLKTEKGSVQRT